MLEYRDNITEPEILNGTGKELIQELEQIEQKLADMSVMKYRYFLKTVYPLGWFKMTDSLEKIREFLDLLKHEEELGHFDYQPVEYEKS